MQTVESERIVNISELVEKIQRARLTLIAVKKSTVFDGRLDDVINDLWECEHFDFVLERRKIIYEQSLSETLKQQGMR